MPVVGVVVIVSECEVRKWMVTWLPTVGNKNSKYVEGKAEFFGLNCGLPEGYIEALISHWCLYPLTGTALGNVSAAAIELR